MTAVEDGMVSLLYVGDSDVPSIIRRSGEPSITTAGLEVGVLYRIEIIPRKVWDARAAKKASR